MEQVRNLGLASDVGRANLLTNGGFEIWQRGNGPFTTAVYCADRWQINIGGGSTISVQRAGAGSGPGGAVSGALQATYTHSSESYIAQSLKITDSQGLIGGRTFTFAADLFCGTANAARLRIGTDGTGGAATYSAYVAGDSTWHRVSVTATVPPDATIMSVGMDLMASCTAYIDNAMLVIGNQAADYVPMHPADDLARCLRYYELVPNPGVSLPGIVRGYSGAGGGINNAWFFKAVKAITPTTTKLSTWTTSNCGQPSVYGVDTTMASIQIVATAAGDAYATPGSAGGFSFEANP